MVYVNIPETGRWSNCRKTLFTGILTGMASLHVQKNGCSPDGYGGYVRQGLRGCMFCGSVFDRGQKPPGGEKSLTPALSIQTGISLPVWHLRSLFHYPGATSPMRVSRMGVYRMGVYRSSLHRREVYRMVSCRMAVYRTVLSRSSLHHREVYRMGQTG